MKIKAKDLIGKKRRGARALRDGEHVKTDWDRLAAEAEAAEAKARG